MSRKDYREFAAVLREAYKVFGEVKHSKAAIECVRIGLCVYLKRDNPAFDREKFEEVCEP